MYRVVNIPHPKNPVTLEVRTATADTVKIVCVDPKVKPPFDSLGVCDLYIGPHMLKPEMREALFDMIGRAIISGIESGRAAGYSMAQADIRNALGIKR